MTALRFLAAGICVVVLVLGARAGEKKADTNKEKIVGTWEVAKADGALPLGSTVEYGKDGKAKVSVKNGENTTTVDGTYTVEGDKLKLALKAGDTDLKMTLTIKKLTDKEYVSENEQGKTTEFKRKK